jgi:DNA uptake protein ComE-like DNA-binding protein
MRKRTMHLVLGAAIVALVGGCSATETERRTKAAYKDVTGSSSRPSRQVDLNNAPQKELAKLPGITDDDAARIVANRPYGTPRGLVRKNVIGEQKYEQIREYVYVTNRQGKRDYGD